MAMTDCQCRRPGGDVLACTLTGVLVASTFSTGVMAAAVVLKAALLVAVVAAAVVFVVTGGAWAVLSVMVIRYERSGAEASAAVAELGAGRFLELGPGDPVVGPVRSGVGVGFDG